MAETTGAEVRWENSHLQLPLERPTTLAVGQRTPRGLNCYRCIAKLRGYEYSPDTAYRLYHTSLPGTNSYSYRSRTTIARTYQFLLQLTSNFYFYPLVPGTVNE